MESGIDPGQDYYTQDYYNYDHGYDLPQYGSRRKLISPSGLYDEYGEVVVDDDGSYYYSPQESEAEGSRKRRIKLVFDREYETSSTGEESLPETQRSRFSSTHNSHVNVNGGLYVAQNGSIIRTRRSVTTAGSTHTTATSTVTTAAATMNNNLKLSSPVFSSRLTKHFKKLDKMAATLEERVPLNTSRTAADGGRTVLRTFQGARTAASTSASASATATTTSSFTHSDSIQTLNVFNTRQSSVALRSNSTSNTGPESGGSPSQPPPPPPPPPPPSVGHEGGVEEPPSTADRGPEEGERESKVDEETEENNNRHHHGHVSPLECPSDRTQSDEEELWMGPWNSLHIPMTKL